MSRRLLGVPWRRLLPESFEGVIQRGADIEKRLPHGLGIERRGPDGVREERPPIGCPATTTGNRTNDAERSRLTDGSALNGDPFLKSANASSRRSSATAIAPLGGWSTMLS